MTDLIADFAAARHDYHQITPGRRRDQMRVLRALEEHAGGVDKIDDRAVQAYLTSRSAEGKAPNTVLKELKMVRPFFTWLWDDHKIDGELLMRVRAIKPPRGACQDGTPNPYSRERITQLYRDIDAQYPVLRPCWHRDGQPDEDRAAMFLRRWQTGRSNYSRVQEQFRRAQIHAIVALALQGAIRKDEIWRLNLDAMHPDNDYIVVDGAAKNKDAESKPRPVPWMSESMRDAVDTWLGYRALLAPDHDSPWLSLFQQHRAKPMPHGTFCDLLLNLGNGYSMHRLRHTAITNMMRSMPEKPHIVQRIAGHARLSQTLRYTELVPGDVVGAANAAASDFARRVAA